MILTTKNNLSKNYISEIKFQFGFLKDFLNYDPGDIEITILSLKEFEEIYEKENGKKSDNFVVGFAAKKGRIFLLDKEDFILKKHNKEEFEKVILHEFCHIFIRRIINPRKTYPWIEEGICQYLSFGDLRPNIHVLVDFNKLKSIEDWRIYHPYQQSALFFKFLVKTYGKNKLIDFIFRLKTIFEERAFKEVFGKELNGLQEDFFASLKNEKITLSSNSMQKKD